MEYAAKSRVITDNFYLTGGTALSEFYLQHRLSEDLDFFSEQELRHSEIASIDDIAVNKLQAILTRLRGRDFVDLYEIIKHKHATFDQLYKKYRLKFDVYVAPEQWAKRFTAVLDAHDQPRFVQKTKWENVEAMFLTEAKNLGKKIFK